MRDDDSWRGEPGDRARDQQNRHTSWLTEGTDNIVAIGHEAKLTGGEKADTLVAIFGSADSAGTVRDSVVAVFGSTRITGPVDDSVVTVFGSTYVDSHVRGDVVTVLGNVELGPSAEIDGDLVNIGGVLRRHPDAVIHGDIDRILSIDLAGWVTGSGWAHAWLQRCLLYGRLLAFVPGVGWAWTVALGFLALYVFLALLFADAVERCVHTLVTQPGRSLLAAFLTVLLTPMVFALLFVTVIGIAVLPFLAVALFVAAMFGKIALLAAFGRRCTPLLRANPSLHTVIGISLAGMLLLLLYTIPVIGIIAYKVMGMLGLGVALYTLILAAEADRSARSATVHPPGAPSGASQGAAFSSTGTAAGAASWSSGNPPHGPDAPQTAATLQAAAPRAGFWIRMGALLLDVILVSIVLQLLNHSGHLEVVALAAYGAVMWKLKGTTVGGIICGLHVVRTDGRELDWTTVIVRALGCFLSLAVLGLGFIWIAFDAEKQSWHDKLAGTLVVRTPRGAPLA